LDEIDREILKIMSKKPDMPFLQIAKKLGISPITVQKRFEDMKKEGIFFRSTLILDLSKIGFKGKAFLFIKFSKDCNIKKIVEALHQMTNVFLFVEIVGTFDMLAMVVFRDITEIMEIVNDIKATPCVEKVEISLTNESFYPFRKEYTELGLLETETDI
jgi:Lrp/AsnC family transcriptional regulator for asnA, asnC and gidA